MDVLSGGKSGSYEVNFWVEIALWILNLQVYYTIEDSKNSVFSSYSRDSMSNFTPLMFSKSGEQKR